MDKNSLAYFAYGNGPSLIERQKQQATPLGVASQIEAVQKRIGLINAEVGKPSAMQDASDLVWACTELRRIADAVTVSDAMIARALDAAGRRGGELGPVRMRLALEAALNG